MQVKLCHIKVATTMPNEEISKINRFNPKIHQILFIHEYYSNNNYSQKNTITSYDNLQPPYDAGYSESPNWHRICDYFNIYKLCS